MKDFPNYGVQAYHANINVVQFQYVANP